MLYDQQITDLLQIPNVLTIHHKPSTMLNLLFYEPQITSTI